jgi:branched-chain amino acid transport system ATP-binding protein
MLEVRGLEVGYGDIQVLWGINLEVREEEIVALVGSNGAGKSTLLRTISGLNQPFNGGIFLHEDEITSFPPRSIVMRGISQVPEGRKLFSGMKVGDNLMMGAYCRNDREGIEEDLAFIFELFPRLQEREKQIAGTLSGGEQQMCAVGRALMSRPRFMLIDELSLGLSPLLVDHLIEAIEQVHERGTGVLLVEQDVQMALEHSQRGYVIETGRITLSGNSQDLLEDPEVKRSFLGM